MARYTDDSKDRVREAADLVALVEARTGPLRRSGPSGFMGLCPFHEERSPSFSVEAHKKLFHCFGCGESGDVFDFVARTEGLDFSGALEVLADRFSVRLELAAEDPEEARRRARRERLLEILERTATFYVRYLWESNEAAKAREYLASRGLEEGVLREFRVGYAPSAWDRVLKIGAGAGFGAREMFDAGLLVRAKGEGRVYDRFRARIMFPLCDVRGRVLGFGARSMGSDRGPKYLNTAENEVFHKGRHLYAADLARVHAAKAASVVLCEGYTDVIALHQAGLRNAVATMGTSLTTEQVGELGKLAPVVALALDADAAGQRAMLRAAEVAAGRNLELRVVPLPEARDPADVVREEGGDAMRALVQRSVPFVRFRVDRALAAGDLSSAEGKDRVLAELRPVFAGLGPSVLREELLGLVTERLNVRGELVASALLTGTARPAPSRAAEPGAGATPARPRIDRRARTERAFLALCLAMPEPGREKLAEVDLDADFTDEPTARAARWLRDHLEAPLDGVAAEDEPLVRDLVARAGVSEAEPASLEAEALRLKIARLDRRIAAGGEGVAQLAGERVALKAELDRAVDRAMA